MTSDRIGPFMLVQDDSSHWYVIPTATLAHWTAWLDSDSAQLGDVPDYAEQVGGSPALVQFTEYKIV